MRRAFSTRQNSGLIDATAGTTRTIPAISFSHHRSASPRSDDVGTMNPADGSNESPQIGRQGRRKQRSGQWQAYQIRRLDDQDAHRCSPNQSSGSS